MYVDVSLIAAIVLLLVSFGFATLYYRQIKRARKSYEEARSAVGDVVMSFGRQLQRQENKLGAVAYKTEAFSSRSEDHTKKLKMHAKQLSDLADKMESFTGIEKKVMAQIETMSKNVDDVITKQESLVKKIADAPMAPEVKIKAAIPIKRERALAPLTETELIVLEALASEGEKTAPEIRDKIKLTREHTARLMKKLYEKGYLERDSGKMPYTYRIKDEMKRILSKTEAKI